MDLLKGISQIFLFLVLKSYVFPIEFSINLIIATSRGSPKQGLEEEHLRQLYL